MSVDEQNFNVSVSEDNFVMECYRDWVHTNTIPCAFQKLRFRTKEDPDGCAYEGPIFREYSRIGSYYDDNPLSLRRMYVETNADENDIVKSVKVEAYLSLDLDQDIKDVRNVMLSGALIMSDYVYDGDCAFFNVSLEQDEEDGSVYYMILTFGDAREDFEYIYKEIWDDEGERNRYLLSLNPDYNKMDIEM